MDKFPKTCENNLIQSFREGSWRKPLVRKRFPPDRSAEYLKRGY